MQQNTVLNYFNSNANIIVDVESERQFWKLILLNNIIFSPKNCPKCYKLSVNINDNESLHNPIIARCSSSTCRKIIYLRENTFFNFFPRTPASLIILIIKIWFIEKNNVNEIYQKLKQKILNYDISKQKILDIIDKARFCIAHYLVDVYKLEDFSTNGGNEYFSIDESNFVNVDNRNLWVLGIVCNNNKKIRLALSFDRDTNIMKKFIKNYVKSGNVLVTDGWGAYQWIDSDINYTHSTHNHGFGDFGYGLDSTSYVESLWSNLKNILRNIYYIIPNKYFLLFLKEAELRRNLNSFTDEEKWKELVSIFNYISDINYENLYSYESLENYIFIK